MQRLDSILASIPASIWQSMLQRGIASTKPEKVTWACSTCGVITPRKVDNGYIRRPCPCERDAMDQKLYQEYRESAWKTEQAMKIARTYTWLGMEYADLGLEMKTFETFRDEHLNDGQIYAYYRAQEYAQKPTGVLLLWSPEYGTGKTHMAAAICNARRAQLEACLFTSGPNLFYVIQDRIQEGNGYQDILKDAYTTPLLCIDDVDKTHRTTSGFREEVFREIIDKRVNRGLPLIITSNTEDLGEFIGGSAASRLQVGLIKLNMHGLDYRTKLIGK